MLILLGFGLLVAAGAVAWRIFRESGGHATSGIQILLLPYPVALLVGSISAFTGYSWSLWAAGLWFVVGGIVVATIGLISLASSTHKFDDFAIYAIPIGSLSVFVGPVGLGIAYLAQHLTIGWSP